MRSTQPLSPDEPRTCRTCGVEKSQSEFYRRGNGNLRTECKVCICAKVKAQKAANPERARYISWRKKIRVHGFTPERWEEMFNSQGRVCAICQRADHAEPSGRRYALDHCHETGVVRGILCSKCNTSLGWVEEVGLQAIDDYLTSLPVQVLSPD